MSSENSPAVQEVAFEKIRTDGGTQVRVELDVSHVNDLVDAIADGKQLPPLEVFFDGSDYWLVDGFHRLAAWRRTEAKVLSCRVEFGDRRAAVLRACGVNSDHGLKRSNADKRNAVMTLLKDEEWAGCSDRWIADSCRVHHATVAKLRAEVQVDNYPPDQKTRRENSDAPSKRDTMKAGSKSPQVSSRSASRVGQDGKVYPARAIEQKSGAPSGVPVSVEHPVESPAHDVPVAATADFNLAAEIEGIRRYLSALLARCPDDKKTDVLDAIKAVVAENSSSDDLVLEPDGRLVLTAKPKARPESKGGGKQEVSVEFPTVLDTPEFQAKWAEWCEYRKTERKKKVSASAAKKTLSTLARYGVEVAIATIDRSIKEDWQGLFPEKAAEEMPTRGGMGRTERLVHNILTGGGRGDF